MESVRAAESGGGHRIELCSALSLGGITPSYGFIRNSLQTVTMPIHVLIRPRPGDFLYSGAEFEVMKADVLTCGELGAHGVVIGLLKADGSIDSDRCRQLIALAKPMSVTFHRAFDFTSDVFHALEEIVSLGCDRILTSGQRASAAQGASFIADLIKKASGRIVIMPGGGLTEKNIAQVKKVTGASEFHLSAKTIRESDMVYRNEYVKLSAEDLDEYVFDVTNAARLKQIIENAK